MQPAFAGDPACTAGGAATGALLWSVSRADLATELARSIALDASGYLYSVHGPNTAARKGSLGVALPDLSAIVRLRSPARRPIGCR
jgi:hypothetical protein